MSSHVDPVLNVDPALLAQSRALGDRTRHALFAYVRDAARPVGVAELTRHFGLNHNAVRQHLAKLRDAGLVSEHRSPPSGLGRPPRRYQAVPGAAERWGGASPHEELSMMLVELIRDRDTPRDVGRAAGRRLAEEDGRAAGTVAVLDAVARRLGFAPRVQATPSGAEVILDRCPFADPAEAAPDVVCEMHRGIAEGIAEQVDDGAVVAGLVVHPPHRAGCRIEVSTPT